MAFVRTKRHGKKTYYYLVESYVENGKHKQRTIEYLGTSPPMGRQKGLKGTVRLVKESVPHEDNFTLPPELANLKVSEE